MSQCYCGQNRPFTECCLPIINGKEKANTAEALMRSRYSAYATKRFDYLSQTSTGQASQNESDFDSGIQWLSLDICRVIDGQESDQTGIVEFKAFYKHNGSSLMVWEESSFINKNGQWLYASGIHLNE